jgi:hypothetical protein
VFSDEQQQNKMSVSCLIQDNEEQRVVNVEVNPLLPDSPQQDVILLLEQRVFREDNPH